MPIEGDPHTVWDEDGWWTDNPPPAGFDGEEQGSYGDEGYRRTVAPAEQAVIEAELAETAAEEEAELAEECARAEALRDSFFGLVPQSKIEGGPPGE